MSRKIPPPFPPFDGSKPTHAPVTLLLRTLLVILLQIDAGGWAGGCSSYQVVNCWAAEMAAL